MEIIGVELKIWLGLVAAIGLGGIWALKKYQEISKDGKISLSELVDTIEEGEKFADEISTMLTNEGNESNLHEGFDPRVACEDMVTKYGKITIDSIMNG